MINVSKLISTGNNLSYLLSPDEIFSETAHKMMQGMLENGFLTCVAYKFNGQVKLMFLTGEKKPLSQLGSIEDRLVLDVVDSIVETAQQISSAGFLSLENIAITYDTIFVDMKSGNCYFIYLPVSGNGAGAGKVVFEKRIIDLLNGLMIKYGTSANLRRLTVEISREGTGLDSIHKVVSQLKEVIGLSKVGHDPAPSIPVLHFVGINTPVPVDIIISKPEFIIGSNVNGVDGTITFSRAISRVHCKFYVFGSEIYIADMGSMNGTYINGKRLQEGQKNAVNIGDRVRLANSEFEIRRG